MATAEEKTTALESQLEKAFKLAESLNKSTDAIIEQGEERKIARQKKNLMEKTEKIHEIKELLREVKVTAETDEQETEKLVFRSCGNNEIVNLTWPLSPPEEELLVRGRQSLSLLKGLSFYPSVC